MQDFFCDKCLTVLKQLQKHGAKTYFYMSSITDSLLNPNCGLITCRRVLDERDKIYGQIADYLQLKNVIEHIKVSYT